MLDRKSFYMRILSWFLIGSLLNATSGCYYYTFTSELSPSAEKVEKLRNSPNYIIVHNGDRVLNLNNVKLDQQSQTLSGRLSPLTPDHMMYQKTKPEPGRANRYKKNGIVSTSQVVNEVHFYVKEVDLREGEMITIPLSAIEKVEVYDPDTGATTASHIFAGLGILAGTFVLIGIIILLTKSSCPFVYV